MFYKKRSNEIDTAKIILFISAIATVIGIFILLENIGWALSICGGCAFIFSAIYMGCREE